ncbi:MAG: glycosyltransferase family 2 protein [Candidatus Brocadiia bacterium]
MRSDRLDHYRALAPSAQADEAGTAGFNGAEGDACVYAETFQEGCCHRRRVKCHHPDRRGTLHDAQDCATGGGCPDRTTPGGVHLGAVITARNEGDEVQATVRSLAASVRAARLTVIVVDDASTDGSCADLRVQGADLTVARHVEPLGVGRARNAGWALAERAGGDVVSFHDAHMRFPDGVLETLARKALRTNAVVCSKSKGLEHQNQDFCGWGCNLLYNERDGLQAKWRPAPEGRAEFARVPAPMGACYVMSRPTANRLERATGRLWDDVAGRWGFSEQALAVKAFLLDIPILVARNAVTRHLYRDSNPVPNAARETWRNVTHVTATLFGRRLFEERFRAHCERHLPRGEVDRIAERAFAAREPNWKRPPEEVFTHLCGKNPSLDEPRDASSGMAARRTVTGSGGPEGPVSGLPEVTVCLLNWRRPANLPEVLESISRQTVRTRVWLWNNAPDARLPDGTPLEDHPLVDLCVTVGRNMRCLPRWWLASRAETEYVCTIDDDLALADERVLEDALAASRELCPDGIVGFFGWQRVDGKGYREGWHVNGSRRDRRVDLIKGRLMVLRRALLARVPLVHPALAGAGCLLGRADDIYVSLCIGRGRPGAHLVPGVLGKRWRELPRRGAALASQPAHYDEREEILNRLLSHYEKGRTGVPVSEEVPSP